MVMRLRAAPGHAMAHRWHTSRTQTATPGRPAPSRSAVEQGRVVHLGVVAEGEQVVLGGDDLGVAEPLGDLGQRVALLGEQRPAPLAQAVP
jgi:hypothetical protein